MPVFTLLEIAKKISGEVSGDPHLKIENTAEIDKAQKGQITFLSNPKYISLLEKTHASAVIIDSKTKITPSIPFIKTMDAYYGFLQTFLLFNASPKILEPGIHPAAVIHKSAIIGKETCIGANTYIGKNVKIGDRSQIFPNCVILNESEIGRDCLLYPLVSIRENCTIGDRVIIHNGAVVGSDGFGFVPYQGKFHKIPQVGRVIIEDDVEIGANTTIDRATMGITVVKKGVKLDNLVHLAHNVTVGEDTVIAGQSGISGSAKIGKNVMIGGQVGIVGHIQIEDGVKIGAKSGVRKSVSKNEVIFGAVARPIMKSKRIEAAMSNLPELVKRIRELEKSLAKLQAIPNAK